MKNLSLLLFFFLLTGISQISAQREETLFRDGRLGLTGIWGGPKYNFSYFNDDFAYVRGGAFGFEFGNLILIGWSGTNFKDNVVIEGFQREFKLDYHNFMFNITPQSFKVVHPIIGLQLGGGRLEFEDDDSERVFIIQPSAGAEFNLFQWFRAGVEGGYRFVSDVDTDGIESTDVSSPFLQINLKFGFSWGNKNRFDF